METRTELIKVKQEILTQAISNEPSREELLSLYSNVIKQKVKEDLFSQIRNILEKYALTIGKLKIVVDPFIENNTEKKDDKK